MSARYATFLSHNSRDKPAVERIARELEAHGLTPFLDRWDLESGGAFRQKLQDALANCDSAVVFFGRHGQGDWQVAEVDILIERALRQRDDFRIAPALLEGADPERIDSFLRRYGWIDFRPGLNDPVVLDQLFAFVEGRPFRVADDQIRDTFQPYRGLQRFDAEHAELFFGRDHDIRQLAGRVQQDAFVAVVGASGSGKSSLVRAGLQAPAAKVVFADNPPALTITVRPGQDPLRALATQLRKHADLHGPARVPEEPVTWIKREMERMRADKTALAERLHDQFSALVGRVFLFVDQFEELFTQGAVNPAQDCDRDDKTTSPSLSRDAQSFVDNIVRAAASADDAFRVLIAIRADFMGRCLAHSPLKQLLQDRLFLVGELDRDGLRAAIRLPAERSGAFFGKGLGFFRDDARKKRFSCGEQPNRSSSL